MGCYNMAVSQSTALALPDFASLSLREMWDLEDCVDEARAAIGAFIDDEIRRLAAEGWTQTRIAEECGRTQQAISYRMKTRGIEPAHQTKPRGIQTLVSPDPTDAEVVSGEVVDEELPGAGPVSGPAAGASEGTTEMPSHYLPDLLADQADLREMVVSLCGLAAKANALLDGGHRISPRFEGDKAELINGLGMVTAVLRRLKREVGRA